jgi:hypothetical protein
MKKLIVFCLILLISSTAPAQVSKEEKVEQLKNRNDIEVTEIEKDILKLEYPNGKVLIKNIADYRPPNIQNQRPTAYSPTYDSTIIDLTAVDTTLYYQKYSYWQEVPIHNWDFDCLRIGDVNNNGRVELYGSRKYFWSKIEPVTIYELNDYGYFDFKYQYDTVYHIQNIYDIDKDNKPEVHFNPSAFIPYQQRYYSKVSDTSFATELNFNFYLEGQLDDQTLGDYDGDQKTDLVFDRFSYPYVYIFEYSPAINNFDSVYRFDTQEPAPCDEGGYSVGDFDLDGKIDIVFGTGRGNVFVIENEGDNQYVNSWQGMVETYHAYIHTWSHDIDGNGKPEFWVLGDAFYNGQAVTRITIFETNGNNSYEVVGRIDLIGVFSFYAGTMQAVDIDDDGIDEVAVCIDDNFIILKFIGSTNHHTYELYYIKQNELNIPGEFQVYFGATMAVLNGSANEDYDILISMIHIIEQPGEDLGMFITKIYKPDSTSDVTDDDFIPQTNMFYQNYPNPFNPSTHIKFSLIEIENVSIRIYDILGKEIKLLLEKNLPAGEYTIQWDGKDDEGNVLPGGVYFIQMTAGNYRQTIKTVLLK